MLATNIPVYRQCRRIRSERWHCAGAIQHTAFFCAMKARSVAIHAAVEDLDPLPILMADGSVLSLFQAIPLPLQHP